jgi:DNA repair photolyase
MIEPCASTPTERIKVLKDAKDAGIRVFGFISPVIPGITKLDELFRELSFASYTWVELLNTTPAAMGRLMPVLRKHFPEAVPKIDFAINHEDDYYRNLEKEIRLLEKKHGFKVREIVRHGD